MKKIVVPVIAIIIYILFMHIIRPDFNSIIPKDYLQAFGNFYIYFILCLFLVMLYSFDFSKYYEELNLEYKTGNSLYTRNQSDERVDRVLDGVLLVFCFQIIANMLVIFLRNGNVLKSENELIINEILRSSPTNFLLLGMACVVFGPIVEELIFRKTIFELLRNDKISIVISSVIFGLIHVVEYNYNFWEMILASLPYISSGIVLGVVYSKSEYDIKCNIYIHMICNLICVLLVL